MKQPLPWSINGIPREIREVARAAAAREGITVGDWITRLILSGNNPPSQKIEAAAQPTPDRDENAVQALHEYADLAARLTCNKADMGSALRRIDEMLKTLSQRLDTSEQAQSDALRAVNAAAAEVNAAAHDQASAYALLVQRIDRMEQGAGTDELRDAVRGAHQGMSRLSEQIAKVSSDTGNALASLRSIVDALTENLTSASAESGRIAQLIEERYLTFELRLDAAETRADSARTAQTETLQNALLALTHRFDEAEKRFHETLNGLKTSLAEAAKRSDPARAETSADTRPASPQPHPIRETVLPATSVSTRSADYLAQTRRAAKPVSQVAPDGTKPNASTVAQGGMRRATKPAALAITVFLLAAAGILTHHYITRPVGPSASSPRGQAIAQSVEPSSSALNRLLAKAEADDASAQFLLGVQLLQKGNPAANASEAAAWLHKAAGSGLAIAQYRLAVLYEKGHGVPRDSDQAAAWYLSAAKLGNRLAMHNLGVAYANGNGVRQSYEDAAHWFQAAADLGLVASQFNLGVLYERGFGVPASLEEAYEWYAIAAANGDADSQARLSVLAAQLRPADRIAAERNAKTFKTHPLVPAANEAPALRQIAS